MLNKFIYIDSKEEFLNLLNQGEVLDEAIVFIEDTREIWNHGTYFDGKSVNDYVSQQLNEVLSVSDYEFVDLGLPSGLKWATCNVGASSPEEGGLYFAWGETEGHTKDTDRVFDIDSYKHYKDEKYTKYTTQLFEDVDDLTTLEPIDDAAYVLDTCRMPTKDDFEELVNNTDFKHIQIKGINVLKCISRVNDNYILIPLAGSYCLDGSKLLFSGSMAMLWSSSLDCSSSLNLRSERAYILRIDLTQPNPYVDTTYRDFGVNIRPVLDSTFSSKTNFKDVFLKIFNLKEELKATKTEIPTKVSQLENNSNYITKTEVFNSYLVKGNYALESDIEIENGVYAVTTDGKLIDYNTADTTAIGVALVAGEHKFMIAKSDATNNGSNYYLYWTLNASDLLLLTNYSNADGTNNSGYLPKSDGTYKSTPNLSSDFTTWEAGALSDFNGKDNTAVIVAESNNAKDMCAVLNTFNAATDGSNAGKNDWYVPACGQLALIHLNKTEINAALAKIGGTALSDYYWSSSEKSSKYAWCVDLYDGHVYTGYKSNDSKVRFVRDFPVKPLNERVSDLETLKQDVISDLEEIRSGSALGATALQALDLNNYALSVNGQINNINSNMNSVSSEVANVKRTLQNVTEKANKADTTASNALNLAEGIQGHLSSFALKSELPTKVSLLDNDACYVLDIVIDNGIYAIESGGNLIPASEATPSCIGVAVVLGEHRFMIGKYTQKLSEKPIWGNSSYLSITNYETVDGTNSIGYLIEEEANGGIVLDSNYHNWTEGALSDFWGNHNTNVMREKGLDGIVPLVDSFNNGNIGDNQGKTDWYVPSCGQLALIVLNMAAISSVLLAIGGDDYETLYNYWCSTESTIDTAWRIDMSTSKVHTANKSLAYRVCLIRSLDNLKSITERVSDLEDNKADKTEIPTKVSQLENDVPYALKSDVEVEVEAPNGVYAVTAYGRLIDYHTADSSCIGVAFISANQKVMIAKGDATNGTKNTLFWGNNLKGQDVPNLEYLTDETAAKADYNGKANTTAIIAGYAALGKDMDSRDMCKVLETYNEGGYTDWYVPAAGQLYEFYTNKTAIEEALTAINGTKFNTSFNYWSSSEKSDSSAWLVYFSNDSVGHFNKGSGCYVRFVRDLSPKPLKEKVTELENNIPTKLSQLENDTTYVSEQLLQLEVIQENGIYAVKSNGELCPVNQADRSCIAIALVTDDQKIMIERDGDNNPEWYNSYGNKFYWSSELYTRDVPNISNVSDPLTDFNGKLNTEALLNAYTEFGVSIHDYDIINILNKFNSNSESNRGYSDWYIPSAGLLYQIMQNYEQINEALLLIGGGSLQGINWSSSEYNANQGYGSYMNDVDDIGITNVDKYVMRSLRLVRDLSISKSIKNITSDLLTTTNNLEKNSIKICKESWLNDLDFDSLEGPLTNELFVLIQTYDAIEIQDTLLLREYKNEESVVFSSNMPELLGYNISITFFIDWYYIDMLDSEMLTFYPYQLDFNEGFKGENYEDFLRLSEVHTLDITYPNNDSYARTLFNAKNSLVLDGQDLLIFTGCLEIEGVVKYYDLHITETTWKLVELINSDYKEIITPKQDGVYAVTSDNNIVTLDIADETCIAVALIKGPHKFIINKSDAFNYPENSEYLYYGDAVDSPLNNYNSAIEGLDYVSYLPKSDGTFEGDVLVSSDYKTWTTGALSDFDGKTNTQVIYDFYGSDDLVLMCSMAKMFNTTLLVYGNKAGWYVPAFGQLAIIYLNKEEINNALNLIGGNLLVDTNYWSTTENSTRSGWALNFSNGECHPEDKFGSGIRVRFIRDVYDTPLQKKIFEIESQIGDINTVLESIING